MGIAHGNERQARRRRNAGGTGVGEWGRHVAAGVFVCSAVLFAAGVAAGLIVAGRVGYGLWQDRREEQADLSDARRECAGGFDPQEWGTPEQPYDGCVSERMDGWVGRGQLHPVLFVFIASAWILYLGITGLIALLARDWEVWRR